MDKKVIYIAGPSVFSPKAMKIGKFYKQICARHGFEGIYPLDGSDTKATATVTAEKVFKACLADVEKADYVVADLNGFRGPNVDDGTAIEIAYAYAHGIPVYGYMKDTRSMVARLGEKDENGWAIEDFGRPVNLMVDGVCTKIIEGGFADCIDFISKLQ